MSTFTIYPIRLGHSEIPKSFVIKGGIHNTDGQVHFAHGCYAAKNNDTGKVTLLDSGSAHWKFVEEHGLPYTTNVEKGPNLVEALAKVGIKPEDIERVCYTHLHHDHAANLWLLPDDVPLYVQRAEIENAAAPYECQKWNYTYIDNPVCPYWKEHMQQFVPIDGEYVIEPGLKLIPTPGHTYGSQSIMVDTDKGPYVYVGDLFYVEENEQGTIHTEYAGLDIWYESRAKILQTGATILWLHDEKFFTEECYG